VDEARAQEAQRRLREAQRAMAARRREVLASHKGKTRGELARLRLPGTLVFRRPKKGAEPVLVDYHPDR